MTFAPRIALISGASNGIGRAVAQRCARDGFDLITVDREVPSTLLPNETFFCADLLDHQQLSDVLERIRNVGHISVLVNNAGIVRLSEATTLSAEDLRISMELNVEVPLKMMQATVKGMKHAQYGRIINISSRAVLGKELRSAYSASKAALIGMTRTWALELAQYGVTANSIGPGPIGTELFLRNNPPDRLQTQRLLGQVPLGRLGTPQEVAHAVSFLAHEDAGFVTGQTVYVCGGLSVGLAPV